jgi:hypothetical protein
VGSGPDLILTPVDRVDARIGSTILGTFGPERRLND